MHILYHKTKRTYYGNNDDLKSARDLTVKRRDALWCAAIYTDAYELLKANIK